MRARWIPILSFAMLAVAFVIDVETPQTLVVAILLDVPIVLSAFAGSRTLTAWLVVAALAANAVAGYVNGVAAGGWDAIGLADRALAALSIVLVGWLGTTLQERARTFGRLAAQESRARREAQLAAAVDRIRTSLSHEIVLRAIVREAPALFNAHDARWIPEERGAGMLTATRDRDDVVLSGDAVRPEITSVARRAFDDDDVVELAANDPLGGLVVDGIGARAALALPYSDRGAPLGTLLLGFAAPADIDDITHALARTYARSGSAALAQTRLFAQLAERNDALTERGAVIRDLVYALSHDLRTPLAALGLTFRQAKDGLYGPMPDAYREIVDRSIVATDELQRLAETLLLVARFESGERRPRREPVDVDPLLTEVVGELEPIAAARHVDLQVGDACGSRIDGDRGDLRRALANLVANALEHTPAGGTVTVAAHRNAEGIAIDVADDGPGVAPAARATLFERFANGEGRRGAGSGLGLYIVRRVAEETGGTARYAPRAPHGSIFSIVVPVRG